MKRIEFIRYLNGHHCILKREGANHSIYINLINNKQTIVGRHIELSDLLCKKICKQLGIPEI
jgi:mRNA interferase HicA